MVTRTPQDRGVRATPAPVCRRYRPEGHLPSPSLPPPATVDSDSVRRRGSMETNPDPTLRVPLSIYSTLTPHPLDGSLERTVEG